MSAPVKYIASIQEIHIAEFDFLWRQRAENMLYSTEWRVVRLKEQEERLQAHIEGLLEYAPEDIAPALFEAWKSLKYFDTFATTYGLLKTGNKEIEEKVIETFELGFHEEQMRAQARAIAHSGSRGLLEKLKALPDLGEFGRLCFAEAELFFPEVSGAKVSEEVLNLLAHEDIELRRYAWRVVALNPAGLPGERGLAGALDKDAEIQALALESLAWTGEPQLFDFCRRASETSEAYKFPELNMLAVLAATEEDSARVLSLADKEDLGAKRYALLGTLGQAGGIEKLLSGMDSTEPQEVFEADNAFVRITGCSVRVARQALLPPVGDKEPDEIALLDAEDAAAQWESIKGNFLPGRRYSGGVDITETPADWSEVDMQSRWEHNLRLAYFGKPHLRPVDLERFPLLLEPNYTPPPKEIPVAPGVVPEKRKSYILPTDFKK